MVQRRIARGRFGGDVFRGFLQVEIDVPVSIRLKLDSARVAKRVGNQAAKLIRGRLRKGLDGDGSPLPTPQDGSRAARDTGRLLRSIRFDRSTGTVRPDSRRTRGDKRPGARVRTNFAVMSVHIASGRWPDPMGSQNPDQFRDLGRWTEEAITRELNSKRGGLIAEFRRIRRTT